MMGRHSRSTGRSDGLVCDQCSANIPTDSRFCPECGAPVTQRSSQRVHVRDEYAQRVFTFGCLIAAFVAVVIGLIVGAASKFLGVLVMAAIVVGGVIFMRVLFSTGRR